MKTEQEIEEKIKNLKEDFDVYGCRTGMENREIITGKKLALKWVIEETCY